MNTSRILNYALLAASLAATALAAWFFLEGYSHVPFADAWEVLMDYKAADFHATPGFLFGFHSEHRPLFARVPIVADILWAGGRGYFPFTLIFLIQGAHAWLLTVIARKQTSFQKRHLLFFVALAIFCCFSPAQTENFIWSFQTAFLFNFFFATGAAAAAAAQKQSSSPLCPALVFLCACGAPLCLASGVFVWWIVVALAIAVGLPRKWIAIYAAAAVLTIVLYVQGYKQPPAHGNPLESLHHPINVLAYAAFFLAWSWKWWHIRFGELMVLISLILLARRLLSLVPKFRDRQPLNPWDAVPAAVMIFSIGTGLLAALGRINFGLEQAGSSRYQTPALLFWFMAALLVLAAIPRKYETAFAAFVLTAMLSIFPASQGSAEIIRARRVGWQQAEAAWVSGVEDQKVMDSMIAGNQLPLYWPYRKRSLGLFSVDPGSKLGTTLAVDRIEPSNFCQGSFTRDASFLDKDWPGIRLRGEGRAASSGSTIHEFLTTTGDLRIVGVGAEGLAYAATRNGAEPLIVYGVLDHGKLCAIPTD